ncbi:MAG: hypothetical protein WD229_05885 [Pirellulales bacterium]
MSEFFNPARLSGGRRGASPLSLYQSDVTRRYHNDRHRFFGRVISSALRQKFASNNAFFFTDRTPGTLLAA